MMKDTKPFCSPSAHQTLLRCRALSLPTIRCDIDGRIIGIDALGAPDSSTICTFLQSPECATLLSALTEQWNGQEQPEPTGLGDSFYAIPVAETERRRRSGYLIALANRDSFNDAVSLLQPIGALLRWTGDDAAEIDAKDKALEEFSGKLTESYEEISLLYNLGHFMTELAAPERQRAPGGGPRDRRDLVLDAPLARLGLGDQTP